MFLSCKIRNCGSTSSKPCKTKLHNYCAAPRLRSSWIEQSLARCYKLSTHNGRMLYRGFPSKLHHDVPPWIETGAFFHIRIAIEREKKAKSTDGCSARANAARFCPILRDQAALAHNAVPANARSLA